MNLFKINRRSMISLNKRNHSFTTETGAPIARPSASRWFHIHYNRKQLDCQVGKFVESEMIEYEKSRKRLKE